MTDRLRVGEIFRSFQGEGPAAGQTAGFLRLMGCNLSCSVCDTAWTWRTDSMTGRTVQQNTHLLTPVEILVQLPTDVAIYVITGGEPLLQQDAQAFTELLPQMAKRALVHVETNGTIQPNALFIQFVTTWVVSPKLSAMPMLRPQQDPTLHSSWLGGDHDAHLKVACRDHADVAKTVVYADSVNWPRRRVWVMPEGTTKEVIDQRWPEIAHAAIKRGVNATHRLHLLAGVR